MAKEINESDWQSIERQPKYQVKTRTRRKPKNVKQAVVKKREFKNIKTTSEDFVHLTYRPAKCQKNYRLIILRKTLEVTRGETELFDDVRYFFYITNGWQRSTPEMIQFYRGRSDHENDIDQLKNGLNAIAPTSDTLLSNWALMTIASLA